MNTTPPRVPLFDRLPEIYRSRDVEQSPPNPLRAYLAAIEELFGALHENIAQLYEDLFIDTCDDWVIPYIADLLGRIGDPRAVARLEPLLADPDPDVAEAASDALQQLKGN